MKFESILKIVELFFLMILGIILSGMLVQILQIADTNANAAQLRAIVFIQSACIFLLPTIVLSILNKESWALKTHLINVKHSYNQYVYAILILLVSMPFVSFLSQLNLQLKLPSNFTDLEEMLKNSEIEAQKITSKILNDTSILVLFINLFVIAFFAAFSEEIFFRGTFQRILRENINYHAAIFIVAFVFSILHFQFYGFLPRLFLGILLGYVYEYGRNIWFAIAVHFLNNAIVIILNRKNHDNEILEKITNPEMSIFLIVIGVISLLFSVLLIKRFRNSIKQ